MRFICRPSLNMHTLISDANTLLFDLDGTLVDSVVDLYVALNHALVLHQFNPVSLDDVSMWVGRGAKNLTECALTSQADVAAINCLELVLADFLAYYQDNLSLHTQAYAGVREFLAHMRQAGKRMAVVTNKPEKAAVSLLTALDLNQYFELVVGGDTTAFKKPDPTSILYALNKLGVSNVGESKASAVMVGDSKYDVLAAKAAGLPCIAIRGGYNQNEDIALNEPEHIVDSLTELL